MESSVRFLLIQKDPQKGTVFYYSNPNMEFSEAFGLLEEAKILLQSDYRLARSMQMRKMQSELKSQPEAETTDTKEDKQPK